MNCPDCTKVIINIEEVHWEDKNHKMQPKVPEKERRIRWYQQIVEAGGRLFE